MLHRLKYESWLTYFAIFYVPIGLLLLLLRLCIGVQVLLLLLLVPDRFPWKRQVNYCSAVCNDVPILQGNAQGNVHYSWDSCIM